MEEKREIIYSDISSDSRKKPYAAMVYLEGTKVIAVDSDGHKIASGTGGTDDATVIQAAIDHFPDVEKSGPSVNKNVGKLYISRGRYYINTPLVITQTVDFRLYFHLCGDGGYTYLDGSNLSDGESILTIGTTGGNCRNWTVSDLWFSADYKAGVNGIKVIEGGYCTIRDCFFGYFGPSAYAIYWSQLGLGRITNCLIYECTGSAIYLNASAMTISNNTIGENIGGTAAIYISNGHNNMIVGNVFNQMTGDTYAIRVGGLYNQITGNAVYSSKCGIKLDAAKYTTVSGNSLQGTGDSASIFYNGVTTKYSDGCTIANNLFSNYHMAICGEGQSPKNDIITGNRFDTIGSHPVYNLLYATIRDNFGYISPLERITTRLNLHSLLGSPTLLMFPVTTSGIAIETELPNTNTLTASEDVTTWHGYSGRSKYYDFNGTSHYIHGAESDTSSDFGTGAADSPFTVFANICPTDVTAGPGTIIGKWDESGGREWKLYLDNNGHPTFRIYDESADKYIGKKFNGILEAGYWTTLVVTYDGSGTSAGCNVYKGGKVVNNVVVQDAEGYVAMEPVSTPVTIGASYNSTQCSDYFDGKINYVGVYASELSAETVWNLSSYITGLRGSY